MKQFKFLIYVVWCWLLPIRVLPLSMIDFDPFWRLAYHREMWKAFGYTFVYNERGGHNAS